MRGKKKCTYRFVKSSVSVHRQPAFINLASRSVANCEFLCPKCGPLKSHLTAEMILSFFAKVNVLQQFIL